MIGFILTCRWRTHFLLTLSAVIAAVAATILRVYMPIVFWAFLWIISFDPLNNCMRFIVQREKLRHGGVKQLVPRPPAGERESLGPQAACASQPACVL
jgi:hypothetical protein